MAVEVCKVISKSDEEAFFRFPWSLYQDYPCWVSDLPSLRRESLDREKHAAWEYLKGDYYLARRDGEVVGTIAAFVNHRHNEYHEENIGFFGFFECIDDQEVANALFQAAEAQLRAMQVTAIRGPASFSSNELYGLQVDSFEHYPMVLMPYNPPYYTRLIENYGFQKEMELLSWKADKKAAQRIMYEPDGTTEARLIRTVRKNMERRGITVRTINTRDKKQEFEHLKALYNAAWEKNWGFVPMTERELNELVKSLGLLLMPKYTFFGEVKGEKAGFLLLIPNLNEVLSHVKAHPGKPEAWWLLKTVWNWKIRPKVKSMRAILMGVKEEYRGLGVDAAMHLAFAETFLRDPQFEWAEASWVLETNHDTNRLLEHFGCTAHRHHRMYQKPL